MDLRQGLNVDPAGNEQRRCVMGHRTPTDRGEGPPSQVIGLNA